jgi:hypothetical protein
MPTEYTWRTPVSTNYTTRVSPTKYITLLTGLFSDGDPYIITDEDWNAIFVNDTTGYPVVGTNYTTRPAI